MTSRAVGLISHLIVHALLLIVIMHNATGGSVFRQDTSNFQEIDLYNYNENIKQYKYEPNITNINTIEDNDPDYPYDKLLQIVKETKMLLRSENVTEKEEKLKLDPSVYQNYLDGDFSDSINDFLSSSDIPAYAGFENDYRCNIEIIYTLPRRMKSTDGVEHYILNLGKEFKQKINTVNCRVAGKSCGDPSTWPENYEHFCEQGFGRRKKLISIPVGNELSLLEQKEREFRIPDSCVCSKRRKYY